MLWLTCTTPIGRDAAVAWQPFLFTAREFNADEYQCTSRCLCWSRMDCCLFFTHYRTKTYRTPATCDQCGDMLWGVAKQGLRCKGVLSLAATYGGLAPLFSHSLCIRLSVQVQLPLPLLQEPRPELHWERQGLSATQVKICIRT